MKQINAHQPKRKCCFHQRKINIQRRLRVLNSVIEVNTKHRWQEHKEKKIGSYLDRPKFIKTYINTHECHDLKTMLFDCPVLVVYDNKCCWSNSCGEHLTNKNKNKTVAETVKYTERADRIAIICRQYNSNYARLNYICLQTSVPCLAEKWRVPVLNGTWPRTLNVVCWLSLGSSDLVEGT